MEKTQFKKENAKDISAFVVPRAWKFKSTENFHIFPNNYPKNLFFPVYNSYSKQKIGWPCKAPVNLPVWQEIHQIFKQRFFLQHSRFNLS
jgi:hypothetical protein